MLLVAGAVNVALHFAAVLRVNPGVQAENTMAMSVSLPPAQYATPDSMRNFYRTLTPRLAALPGVTAVGGGGDTPFAGTNATGDFEYEEQPNGTADRNPFAGKHAVTPGFFAAVGTPILKGRDFNQQDEASTQPVVILNRTMAQKLWPGQDPLSKHVKLGNTWAQVVGVVADIHYDGPAEPVGYQIYQSVNQNTSPFLTFVLRTSPQFHANPLTLAEPARQVVCVDRSAPRGFEYHVAGTAGAGCHLGTADVDGGDSDSGMPGAPAGEHWRVWSDGVHGEPAGARVRHPHRVGSDRAGIVRLLFSGVLRLALVGIVLGAGLAYAARLVNSLMGAGGSSPAALLLGALLVSAVAAVATLLPARRAMRVEPMEALRSE